MTTTIILKDASGSEETRKPLKPIEIVKILSLGLVFDDIDTHQELSDFDCVELVCRGYNYGSVNAETIYDLIFAYHKGLRNDGTLYLGHWNDGIV